MANERVLASPAIGTSLASLIRPCGDARRPAEPPDPPTGPAIGLTFSGGGFRATLASLGVIPMLADAGLPAQVRSGEARVAGLEPGCDARRGVLIALFDRLEGQLCRALVSRDLWLTAASLSRSHSDGLALPDLGDGSPLD